VERAGRCLNFLSLGSENGNSECGSGLTSKNALRIRVANGLALHCTYRWLILSASNNIGHNDLPIITPYGIILSMPGIPAVNMMVDAIEPERVRCQVVQPGLGMANGYNPGVDR
jgi:hypothetical protein